MLWIGDNWLQQRGGKLLACHRHVLTIEGWQGKWGYTIMQWSSYAVFESHENGWWKPTIWQVPQTYYLEDRVIARCTRNISFCYISSYSNCILGIVYPEELLTDGPMSSACAKRRSIKWSQLPLDHGWTRWNWSRYQSPSEHS